MTRPTPAATLTPIARRETNLAEDPLNSELARTTFQCRLFAQRLASGAFADIQIDAADDNWPTGPDPTSGAPLFPWDRSWSSPAATSPSPSASWAVTASARWPQAAPWSSRPAPDTRNSRG